MKVILFNAPPNSGKTYSSEWLREELHDSLGGFVKVTNQAFADPVNKAVKSFFSLSEEQFEELATREMKEVKQESLGFRSLREARIWLAEDLIKPRVGRDFFAAEVYDGFERGWAVNIVHDLGFKEELKVMTDNVPHKNILVVRICAEGTNYEGDSRSPVKVPESVEVLEWENRKDEESLNELWSEVVAWLHSEEGIL